MGKDSLRTLVTRAVLRNSHRWRACSGLGRTLDQTRRGRAVGRLSRNWIDAMLTRLATNCELHSPRPPSLLAGSLSGVKAFQPIEQSLQGTTVQPPNVADSARAVLIQNIQGFVLRLSYGASVGEFVFGLALVLCTGECATGNGGLRPAWASSRGARNPGRKDSADRTGTKPRGLRPNLGSPQSA